MASRLNVVQSMRIIDRHLLPSAGEQTARSSIVAGIPRLERTREGRAVPPAATLPAFYTCARDGPSPYDPHKGDYQCSVDDVWNDQTPFELGVVAAGSAEVHWHKDGPDQPVKSAEALRRMEEGGADAVLVTADSLRMPTTVIVENRALPTMDGGRAAGDGGAHSSQAPAAPSVDNSATAKGALLEEVWVTNPLKDRLALESEVGHARAARVANQLAGGRRSLYRKCVRAYPHGALGIRESPYGPETGNVYAEHRQQLLRNALKEGRALRRVDVPKPSDSLFGSYVCHGEERVHGPRTGNAPRDHLLGGVVCAQEGEPPQRVGNSSSMFYSV